VNLPATVTGGPALSQVSIAAAAAREFADDLDVLQFVLGLEHLSYALYSDGLRRFSAPRPEAVRPSTNATFHFTELRKRIGWLDESRRPLLKDPTLQRIRDHERFHAKLIASRIAELGSQPADPPIFEFAYEDFHGFLTAAARLEDAVVQAYATALPALGDPGLRGVLAGLLTVEAQHAAHLHLRAGHGLFSFATERPATRAEIASIVGDFIAA
jgi:hypothetical protein